MQAVKVIALGLAFSITGTVICVFVSIILGGLRVETSHATGLSAVVGGILEAFFSPLTWLVILVSFGAALWLVRRTTKTNANV